MLKIILPLFLVSSCMLPFFRANNVSHGVYNSTKEAMDEHDEQLQNPFPKDKKSRIRGKKLFAKHCVECHGKRAIGNGPKAADLDVKPPNLRKIKEANEQFIYRQIAYGQEDMPSYGIKMNDEQIWDLTNYVLRLNQKKKKKKKSTKRSPKKRK